MLRPGDRIGDWEVVLPLGQGGMGSVCRCRHALSHRIEAAVKVLKPTDMAGARERFIREAEALHALSHPAIVRVHGFGLDARTELLWLAMELVSGQNFEFLLQDGEFPSERAAEIFGTVAEGLAYAHSRGIVHRDIKPGNLMLRDDGRAILLDFGIAVQEGHERLTQEGVVPGTVAYAAPEQVTFGTDHDPALSDLYSLGQVLCECLTGRFVYPRRPDVPDQRRAVQILKKKLRLRPLDPGEEVPEHVRELVLRATDPDPARRGPPLSSWADVLAGRAHVAPAGPEVTDLHMRVAPLAEEDEDVPDGPTLDLDADDVSLDGPSVEMVAASLPADLALPDDGEDPPTDVLDDETDVRSRRPWLPVLLVLGSMGLVVVVGLLLVGGAGVLGAAWVALMPSAEPGSRPQPDLADALATPPVEDSDTDVELPVQAPDTDVVDAPAAAPDPDPRPAPRTPTTRGRAAPPTSGTGDARLVVAADRTASVYLDGMQIRDTPVTRRLDPGDYTIELRSGSVTRRFRVHLEAGETARRIWDFDQGQWRSFDGGLDEEGLAMRPPVRGLETRVRALPAVKACLADDPQPWTITLRFLVVQDGSVVSDAIEPESLAGSALERCLFDAVRSLDLGPSQAGAAVRVRLPPAAD